MRGQLGSVGGALVGAGVPLGASVGVITGGVRFRGGGSGSVARSDCPEGEGDRKASRATADSESPSEEGGREGGAEGGRAEGRGERREVGERKGEGGGLGPRSPLNL